MALFDSGEFDFMEDAAGGTSSAFCGVEEPGNFSFEFITPINVEPEWFTRAYAAEECEFFDV